MIQEEHAVSKADDAWKSAIRGLSVEQSLAVQAFCQEHKISPRALLLGCWSEVVGCYSNAQTAYFARDESVQEFNLQGRSSGSCVQWLQTLERQFDSGPSERSPQTTGSHPSQRNQLSTARAIVAEEIAQAARSFSVMLGDGIILVAAARAVPFALCIDYLTDAFTDQFVEILLDCMMHLLNGALTCASQPVFTLPVTSPEIKQQWCEPETLAFDLIRLRAASVPRAIACIEGEQRITYRELLSQADELATRLASYGVVPGALVAVHLGRSIDLVITILAIFEIGAVYVPIDISLPLGRVQAVMETSGACLAVTRRTFASRFEGSHARLLILDAQAPREGASSTKFEIPQRRPTDLAYVIFTSGSTGTPKGVMIEQRNLAAFVEAFPISGEPGSTLLAMSSISFDISIIELIWTLTRGMSIVLHPGDNGAPTISGPDSVVLQMEKYRVTHVVATPTMMRILADDPSSARGLQNLRVCVVGGEPFPPALAWLLRSRTDAQIFNAYGPTETTVCITIHPVIGDENTLPIGRPMSNSQAYIVDQWNRELPPLAAGELLIGGTCVGRGYLGSDTHAAPGFVPNMFNAGDNNLLYRTGDLVRIDMSGNLEFVARLDYQVKIRGYRIELQEIESVMRRYPGIAEAAVVVHSTSTGEKSLAGFYTCASNEEVLTGDLSTALSRDLPSYMIPPLLRCLPFMPLATSGKIDRNALAKLEGAAPSFLAASSVESGEAVFSPIEQQLCSWCAELLQLPSVRATDDYFTLGGESLRAAQLMRRISSEYGTELRLSALIEARTMRTLASLIASRTKEEQGYSAIVPFETQGSRTPLFLFAGLGGNVLNFEFAARLIRNRPIYGVDTHGLNRTGAGLTDVEGMAELYLAGIRKIQPLGPYHLVGYSFGGILAFEIAQQIRRAGERVGLLCLLDVTEFGYSRQVLKDLSILKRLNYLYGGTIRRVVAGPDRVKTLRERIQMTVENRRIARADAKRQVVAADVSSIEQRNFYAISRYRPRVYDGTIHLIRSRDSNPLRGSDQTLGWGAFCSSVLVDELPGDHEGIMSRLSAPDLAGSIEDNLESVENFRESVEADEQTVQSLARLQHHSQDFASSATAVLQRDLCA